MIIPRYHEWSDLELQAGVTLIKWDLNSSYGRVSPADDARKAHMCYALLSLIRVEQRKRK